MTMTTEPARKEAWIEPEIKTLDIDGTEMRDSRGGDGSRFVDCTRS